MIGLLAAIGAAIAGFWALERLRKAGRRLRK
jgi:hypothetical protein